MFLYLFCVGAINGCERETVNRVVKRWMRMRKDAGHAGTRGIIIILYCGVRGANMAAADKRHFGRRNKGALGAGVHGEGRVKG